jgi:hypothetical protein
MDETSATAGFKLSIPEHLVASSPDAIARLQYLLPDIAFECDGTEVVCFGPEDADWAVVRQEVYYTMYRAKIRNEGAAQRTALFDAVFGS